MTRNGHRVGSYTRDSLPESSRESSGSREPAPARSEPSKLRVRPLGYRRADVDRLLDARDAELAELRQDIAALWLAFAHHDRLLKAIPDVEPSSGPGPEPVSPGATDSAQGDAASPSIGEQLAELDDVLAAIEVATQTLERSYAAGLGDRGEAGGEEAGPPADAPTAP
jgi:hypothetical protein